MPTDYRSFTSEVSVIGLDENFPVPGTNNPSQGLRDNFAKIKSALQQAALELTEMREYVLRKIDEGETFSHDNDVNYYKLFRAQLKAYIETFYDIGESGTNLQVNYLNGNFQKVSINNNCDLALLDFPSTFNSVGRLTLWVNVSNSNFRIFLPVNMVYGVQVNFVSAGKIVFPSPGNYLLEIISVNDASQFWLVAVQGLETSGGAGAGSSYELPIASISQLGGVKVDGNTIGINSAGVIRVIGGGGGGAYAIGATGATGPAGAAGIQKTGSVYSYMYAGSKSSGNNTRFKMITINGVSSNGTLELVLSHHHSGGGQHGAYARLAYAINAYTDLVELERYEKSFDAGTTTGYVGFNIARPTTSHIDIYWAGNTSFGSSYSFYMTINSNQPLTIINQGLD